MQSPELALARFPTKRDAWLVAILWLASLLAVAAALVQLSLPVPFLLRALVCLLLLSAGILMIWALYGTDYAIGAEHLLIRSGPFRFRVPLREIDSVQPSRSPLSSPACSLDRLLIRWQQGRRRILISPAAKDAFLQALAPRCPHLRLEGDQLTQGGA